MSVKKKVDSPQKGSLSLHFKGITPAIVNAIRRTVIIDIPAWSINKFEVDENTSPIINEYITRRISLVPMNNELFNSGTAPPTFILDVKATTEGILNVYSHDIKPEGNLKSKVEYFRPNIIISKLKGKFPDLFESLKIRMSAERNTHRHHASFSSTTAIEYALEANDTECKMVINGNGTYTTENLYKQTIDILIDKLKNVESKMEIIELPENMTKIKIENEDNTLAELLQTHIMEHYTSEEVSFISANKTHPLEDHIIIEIKTTKDIKKIIGETLESLIKKFNLLY